MSILLLYLIYLLSHACLGAYQVIAACFRLCFVRRKDSAYALYLKRYLLAVSFYLGSIAFLIDGPWKNMGTIPSGVLFLVIPSVIAYCHISRLKHYRLKRLRITAYDALMYRSVSSAMPSKNDTLPRKKVRLRGLRVLPVVPSLPAGSEPLPLAVPKTDGAPEGLKLHINQWETILQEW